MLRPLSNDVFSFVLEKENQIPTGSEVKSIFGIFGIIRLLAGTFSNLQLLLLLLKPEKMLHIILGSSFPHNNVR